MASLTDRLLGDPPNRVVVTGSSWVTGLLLAGPPVSVVLTLYLLESVPAAFLVYHVGWCLVVPAVLSVGVHDRPVPAHRAALGLRYGDRPPVLGAGALVGLAMFLGILVPFLFIGDLLLGGVDLGGQLAAWGVPSGGTAALFVYMLVFNSGAEELYWRGYVHERLASWDDRWAAIVLVTAAFTSYHFYTTLRLAESLPVAGLLTVGVFLGGITWAILRERYDSVYPAILAHVGATAGYMTVYLFWV